MEAFFFLIDSVAVVGLVYFGLMDDRRRRGAPMRSPFRYAEDVTATVKPPRGRDFVKGKLSQ